MNIKELNKKYEYIPINKEALNKVIATYNKQCNDLINSNMEYCIFKNKDTIINALNTTFYNIIDNIKVNKDIIDLFNFNVNKKVNNRGSTIKIKGINYKPYLLCLNMINNNCNLSIKCYSNKQELAYKIDNKGNKLYYSLINTLSNFILFYYCIYTNNNIPIYKGILKELKYNTSYFNNNKFNVLRFNNKSDIDNIDILLLFNDIHLFLKKLFNNSSFKSYTYSKSTFLKDFKDWHLLDNNFKINKSYGCISYKDLLNLINNKALNNYDAYITLNKEEFHNNKDQLINLMLNNKIDICLASLNNNLNNSCSNCLKNCYEYQYKLKINAMH